MEAGQRRRGKQVRRRSNQGRAQSGGRVVDESVGEWLGGRFGDVMWFGVVGPGTGTLNVVRAGVHRYQMVCNSYETIPPAHCSPSTELHPCEQTTLQELEPMLEPLLEP